MQDLHEIPKVRDSLTYLYAEHARVDRHQKAIALHQLEDGEHVETPVPVASLQLLMLGPGTSITHAAVRALADNDCLVCWCGEEGVRLYASGTGGTRSAARLLRQSRLAADEASRLAVVERMYRKRLGPLEPDLTLQQIRGKEGVRVREAYAAAS
ncbi:CRISPR-associated endonuclease Cas1, partial [bacterium]|nr:CRISPR-associated endonuclease Cas1 [bacterium]